MRHRWDSGSTEPTRPLFLEQTLSRHSELSPLQAGLINLEDLSLSPPPMPKKKISSSPESLSVFNSRQNPKSGRSGYSPTTRMARTSPFYSGLSSARTVPLRSFAV